MQKILGELREAKPVRIGGVPPQVNPLKEVHVGVGNR